MFVQKNKKKALQMQVAHTPQREQQTPGVEWYQDMPSTHARDEPEDQTIPTAHIPCHPAPSPQHTHARAITEWRKQ